MYTAVYKKTRAGYVAWVDEIPGVNTQGGTKKEAKENLLDALREFVSVRRKIMRGEIGRGRLIRERITVPHLV